MANQLYKGDKQLATFVPQIADNLTTDDSTKALSAKQGKVLNEKIEDVSSQIGTLKYVVLGNITASGEADAWGKVFDSLSDGAYIVQFGFNGAHIGLCFRYGNGQYGMMFGMAYFSLAVYRLKVMSGTKSFSES